MADDGNKKLDWLLVPVTAQTASLVAAIFATLVSNFIQIFTSLFTMIVYNKIIPNGALATLTTVFIGLAVLLLTDSIFKTLKSRIMNHACSVIEADLQAKLYRKVISWDLQNMPKLAGSSASLVKDLENVIELFATGTITVVIGIPFVLINLAVIYLIGAQLAYVAGILALTTILTSLLYYFIISRSADDAKSASIEKSSIFIETLSNLETIKSIGDYSFFGNKWVDTVDKNSKISHRLKNFLADIGSFNAGLNSFGQIIIVSVGAYLVIEGQITSGALIASVMLNSRAQQPLVQLSGLLQKLSTAKASLKKLNQVFNSFSNEEKRRDNLSISEVVGNIELRKLKFQPNESKSAILEIERLRIDEGQKIGIVGSVGSGKSTVLKLISGVLTPTEGSIIYGTYDTSAIHQTDLRRNIGYLGQAPGIFAGTIRENICLSDQNASEEEINAAMKLSGFDRILTKFPNGLSYRLSEHGRELSGGQKQILALSRCFLTNPNYLFLDEPTSAMDPRHEMLFIKNIAAFIKNKTFIAVTHRKPILQLVDRILVIENGKVIIDGERDEVLKKFA